MEIRKHFEGIIRLEYDKFVDTANAVLGGRFTALNKCIGEKTSVKICPLNFHLRKLEKRNQM